MGFQVPRRQARITFEEGHEYHGAEVFLNLDVPLSLVFGFNKLREDDPERAFQIFGDEILSSWNIEGPDGEPLSADYQGLSTLPSAFSTTLMDRWSSEGTAPVPLGQRSSDTDSSVVPLAKTGSE